MIRRSINLLSASLISKRGHDRNPLPYKIGQLYDGFNCIQIEKIDELNITGYHFVHGKTNSSYFHFDSDDNNNSFNITFKTPADSDKGTTHILEHTALCGSRKYPVRDPFFLMLKRSLNTFMNAMTGPDYTMYPFATCNAKDYSNLLDIYLDATLHPLLRKEDFTQEGHRLEVIGDKENTELPEVAINGVVFNEMKGVLSQPSSFFTQTLWKHTHPDTHYKFTSGGVPKEILNLTHKELIDYHTKHYHPSNSVVVTYGDLPPPLERINHYFSEFTQNDPIIIPKTSILYDSKSITVTGPAEIMGDFDKQKQVSVSYVLPDHLNKSVPDYIRLGVLSSLLTDGANAPLDKALLQSQIGTSYSPLNGYVYFMSSPTCNFGVSGVKNTSVDDDSNDISTEGIESLITKTLDNATTSGFEQRRIDGIIFQEQIKKLHRSTSFGIHLATELGAMYSIRGLSVFEMLRSVTELGNIQSNPMVLQDTLKNILSNSYRLTLTVLPDKDYIVNETAILDSYQAEINKNMDKSKLDEIEKINEYRQKHVNTKSDASILPTLTIDDIPTNAFKQPEPILLNQNQPNIHVIPHTTNGLVYTHGFIPLTDRYLKPFISMNVNEINDILIESDFTKYQVKTSEYDLVGSMLLPLFTHLVTECGTQTMNFEEVELVNDISHTGVDLNINLSSQYNSLSDFKWGLKFSFTTNEARLSPAFDLILNIINNPLNSFIEEKNKLRFLSLLNNYITSNIASVTHSGHIYSMANACSSLTKSSFISNSLWGLPQIKFLSRLQSLLNANTDLFETFIVPHYNSFINCVTEAVKSSIFTWITCSKDSIGNSSTNDLSSIIQSKVQNNSYNASIYGINSEDIFVSQTLEEKLDIETSFASKAILTNIKTNTKEHQILRVACQMLKNNYLHKMIREEGGAYGAMIQPYLSHGVNGGIVMGSYRDPTPDKSLKIFDSCSAWLSDITNITKEAVDEAKLSLFSKIDAPQCVSTFGNTHFLSATKFEHIQTNREMLLSVTIQDVYQIAPSFFDNTQCSTSIIRPKI